MTDMAPWDAADLARRLAENAEAVCRHYLSAGRRHGNYWLVGDVHNTPGRSLYVRLRGGADGRGRAGKWTDGATGQHGDLLDIIRENLGLLDFRDVADEARRFLCLPQPQPRPTSDRGRSDAFGRHDASPQASGTADAARRLWAMSRPIAGTLAETWLHHRDLTRLMDLPSLRFHPDCYYRADTDSPTETWPTMIAAVTDLEGRVTGVHRTWLARDGRGKAPVEMPRRAMGDLLGHAVRFGTVSDVLAAGEGIETVLSLHDVMPDLPLAACLSSAHLAAMTFPPSRDGGSIRYARNLIATLRQRELEMVGRNLSGRSGIPFRQSGEGDPVAGSYRQRFNLASGRFAMIDDGLGFELVPWSPSLEKQRGREVSGIMRGDGGIDWSFARKRGRGL